MQTQQILPLRRQTNAVMMAPRNRQTATKPIIEKYSKRKTASSPPVGLGIED